MINLLYPRPLALADMSSRGGLGLSRRGGLAFAASADRWGKQRPEDTQIERLVPAALVGADWKRNVTTQM